METIRILLYTDSFDISKPEHLRGLTILQQFIKLKINGIANVEVALLNRHFDYKTNQCVQGATLLTSELLKDHDELWVFGYRKVDSQMEPHNELKSEERAALLCWMNKGGVLITGDHSEAVGAMTCNDRASFINLGAAIGRDIPRAGKMRVWDGPPTNCIGGPLEARDNHNTQVGGDPLQLDTASFQSDPFPQTLRLTPSGPPHRLFWWYFDPDSRAVVPIDKFPDHAHEGDVVDPTTLKEWPTPSRLPEIVALGRDNRFPKEERWYRLVSAYDGDPVCEGRIVADSSFHHYMDRNLSRLRDMDVNRNPVPGSDLDQIAQYYCNLTLWLAPKEMRNRIGWGLFFWVATHPDVLEDKGNPPDHLGRTALNVVASDIGASNLYRLLAPDKTDQETGIINVAVGSIFLGIDGHAKSPIKREIVLGHIIQQYHQYFAEVGLTDLSCLEADPEPIRIILKGLNVALNGVTGGSDYLALFQSAATEFK